ncbi:Gem-associated protein 5 [Entomophthora muscae]|uniref:Gem-associated protein 5 n=1 Tax=Entomophthora muscae TaxID=34485 RepID=A0ACC2REQ6_9FUNG|nr:Gem-associated protein 5 [Entomophthora muscae]
MRVVSTSMDRSIILWDQEKILHSINTLGGPARSLAFAPLQPELAAVGVADKAIRLWSHQEACAYYKRTLWYNVESSVSRVAFHPAEGGVLAFANSDGAVGVFTGVFSDNILNKGEKVYRCPSINLGPPDSLQWVPLSWATTNITSDEAMALVSFSIEGYAVCNFYPSIPIDACLSPLFTEKLADVSHVMFASSHAWVAVGFFSGIMTVFAMPSFVPIYSSTCSEACVKALEWSHNDDVLAVGHKDGSIFVHAASRFSAEGGVIVPYPQPSFSLLGHTARVLTLNWSPHSETLLASGDSAGNTYIWDSSSCAPVASFKVASVNTLCVRWSPLDPNLIFSCSDNGTVWQWNMVLNPFGGFHEENVKLPIDKVPVSLKRARETDKEWTPVIHALPAPTPKELLELGSHPPSLLPLSDKSYYLNLWGGQTHSSFQEMASQREPQKDLTKWLLHLALSPLDGPEAYSQALLQTAQAYRAKDGDPHISASLFASAGHVTDAIECLTSKGFYLDAVALAQNRLPEGHPHLVNLYLAYARHLLHAKSTEEACRWFILGKDIGSAIDAIASRNTRDSLLAALELSLKNNHETYPLRIWRYSVACQVEGAHGEAALALFNLPPSLPVVASLIFTLTDGSYIYTNDTPVENEDVIDLEDFESDNDSSATVTSHFFISSFRISNRSFRCGPNLACRSRESATCFTKERTTP